MSLHHAEYLMRQPGVQTIKTHREQGASTARLPVRQRATGEIFDEHKRLQTEAPRMKKQFPNVKHYAATHMYDLLAHTNKVTNPRFQTIAIPRGSQPITVVTGVTTARGSETERETARTERTQRTARETVTRPTVAAVTGTGTGSGSGAARSASARKSLTRTASAPVFHYSSTPLVVEAAPTIKLKSATGATLTYTLVPTTSQPVATPAPAPAAQARGSAPAPAPAPVSAAQQRVNEAAAAQRAAANQQSATDKVASEQRREERAASRAEHSAMVSTVKPKIRERSDDVLRDSFGRMLVDHETLAPVTVSEFLQKQKERSRSTLKQSKDDSHLAAAIGYGKRHRNYTAYVAGVDKIDEPHFKDGQQHKPTQAEHDTKLYTVKHNTLFSPRDYQVPMTIATGGSGSGSNRVLATTSARGSSTARVAATITKSTPRTASGRAVGGRPSSAAATATTSASIRKFNDDPPSSYRAGPAALGYGKRHRHYNAYVRATA